jgi:hypothetical protein
MKKPTSSIKAGICSDADGNPHAFTLSMDGQLVTLEPGKPWAKVDEFKWVTRGLIEPPQSFHVLPGGTVEINGEKIALNDAEAISKLEFEINKNHALSAVPHAPMVSGTAPNLSRLTPASHSDKVCFYVKLDHLGHLAVECVHGEERVVTGLRGFPGLVQNGLMIKPKEIHVDPLQRYVEIDGVRFECNEAGARRLQETLNAQYAPPLQAKGGNVIDIRENPASPTGFDIHFVLNLTGLRVEIKGHLSQEKLDLLQDPQKCDLFKPGILLRLSPPNLLIRRRKPDGGEERLPEFSDVQYRHVTAVQLQQVFNHPLLRRTSDNGGPSATSSKLERPAEIVALRVVRNPQYKTALWLECTTTKGGHPNGKAFTHHNVADLQRSGAFLPHWDIMLSLDHRTLSLLNKQTRQEENLTLDSQSTDADLNQASQILTNALKPPSSPPVAPTAIAEVIPAETPPEPCPKSHSAPAVIPEPIPIPKEPEPASSETKPQVLEQEIPTTASPDPVAPTFPTAPQELVLDPAIFALFREPDPLRVNPEVLRHLSLRLGIPIQDVRLDLPRIFAGRRFEIISLSHQLIHDAFELRSEGFSGFYLSHNNDRNLLLVYACRGRHVEWGPERCLLRASVSAEPNEFTNSALLGMALDQDRQFVFVVTPAFQEWIKPHEKYYQEVYAHFVTVKELAANPDSYQLVWPVPTHA